MMNVSVIRTQWIIAIFTLVIGILSGMLFYRINLANHLESVSVVSERMSALSSSYVSLYSELRSESESKLFPVPAEFRAKAVSRFNQQQEGDLHFQAEMVGVPDRYIKTAPTDEKMEAALNKLLTSKRTAEISEILESDDKAFVRTMYPSIATSQSCVDCHNRIQNPEKPWKVGDLMGAFVVENGIQKYIEKFQRYSIILAFMVSLLLFNIYIAVVFYRDLAKRATQLKHLASTDSLTGCINRREFENRVSLIPENESSNSAFLLLDIDNFKIINDTHGHAVGDEILKIFAKTIQGQLRKEDELARAGGEEFYVYLRNTSEAEAKSIAERLKQTIALQTHEFTHVRFHVTVSIGGLHTSHAPHQTLAMYTRIADNYLYKAKNMGRNRVEWADAQPTM